MPFMLAHPAAALPLYRRLGRYGVLSALIIGSMTPDMHYFLPLAVDRSAAHSAAGLLWFCWPVGFVLYLLYHLLLKHPLALLLPPAISKRVAPWLKPGRLPDAPWSAVALSLLLGAATHIAWDAFTHQSGPMVAVLPVLRAIWFTLDNYPLAGYAVLQQASNVLGFAVLGIWSWRWLRAQSAQAIAPVEPAWSSVQRRLILGILLFVPVAVAALALQGMPTAPMQLVPLYNTLKQVTVAAMSSGALAILTYSLLWQIWARRLRVPAL